MNRTRQTGFTLMELVITLAVAAILMTIGIPNLRDFILNQNLEARANDLIAALNYARGEAITRGVKLYSATAPTSNRGVTIASSSGSGGDWSDGWKLCIDGNNNGNCNDTATTPPDEVLAHVRFEDKITITASANIGTFIYRSNGMVNLTGGVIFHICSAIIPDKGKEIRVTRTGRASITNMEYNCGS